MTLGYLYYLPPKQAHPEAKAAALQALKLNEGLAEAHVTLGFVYLNFDWDWKRAEAEFKRAIELNPNNSSAHLWYAWYLMSLGRAEQALAETKLAQRLDPLDTLVNTNAQWPYFMARKYDAAVDGSRSILATDPNFAFAHSTLSIVYGLLRRFDEAIAEARAAVQLDDGLLHVAILADAYAQAGRRIEAQNTLRDLESVSSRRYVCGYEVAIAYSSLGNRDRAFQWLEKAYNDRADCMTNLRADPRFDSLRPDPRFQEMIRRVGIPPAEPARPAAASVHAQGPNQRVLKTFLRG
jgi:tetratricopeptide (TPR) repeat protein